MQLSKSNQIDLVNAHYTIDFAYEERNIAKMYDSQGLPSKDLNLVGKNSNSATLY